MHKTTNQKFTADMGFMQRLFFNSTDPNTASFSYERLLRHLKAAELQVQRIQDKF